MGWGRPAGSSPPLSVVVKRMKTSLYSRQSQTLLLVPSRVEESFSPEFYGQVWMPAGTTSTETRALKLPAEPRTNSITHGSKYQTTNSFKEKCFKLQHHNMHPQGLRTNTNMLSATLDLKQRGNQFETVYFSVCLCIFKSVTRNQTKASGIKISASASEKERRRPQPRLSEQKTHERVSW